MNKWSNPRLEGRIPELDGIRGIAIGLVVIFHYVASIGAPNHSWWKWIVASTSAFWSGVDLFFVLSGFLIGGILLDSVNSPRFFKAFYFRRFYRILPVYWIWLTIFVAAVWFDADRRFGLQVFDSQVPTWWYVIFIQNNAWLWLGMELPLWMAMSWSLAVEEQFYIGLPAIIRFSNQYALTVLCLLVLVGSPIVRQVLNQRGVDTLAISFATLTRLDGLALGVLVALLVRNQRCWMLAMRYSRLLFAATIVGVTGMATITWAPSVIPDAVRFSVTSLCFSSTLLLVLVEHNSILAGWLKLGVFRYLGRISYTLYVIHQGVRALVSAAFWNVKFGPNYLRMLMITGLSVVVSLIIAEVSWQVMERRAIKRAHELYQY